MRQIKIIVEKHEDGYLAYPLGLKGVVVGEGDSYEEAMADVKSAIQLPRGYLRPGGPRSGFPSTRGLCCRDGDLYLMPHFPVDAPRARVVRTFELLGFRLVREREHIAMVREEEDGKRTPLTMPNHPRIKGSTLRAICTQAGISRNEFLSAFERS